MKQKQIQLNCPDSDVICHMFKVRIGSEIYGVTVCGLRHKAEQYMKYEMKADEIEWIKSFLINSKTVLRLGEKNRSIAREGFFLRMEFISYFGTKHSKPLKEGDENKKQSSD